MNQELYGAPSNLPWAIFIDEAHRLPEFADVAYYHPMFLYESLWNIFTMAVLLFMSHKLKDRIYRGDIFLVYLVMYPFGRFMLEFMRLDPSNVGGFNANQTLMAVIAIVAVLALFA